MHGRMERGGGDEQQERSSDWLRRMATCARSGADPSTFPSTSAKPPRSGPTLHDPEMP